MSYYIAYEDNSSRNLMMGIGFFCLVVALIITMIVISVNSLDNDLIADAEKAQVEYSEFVKKYQSEKSSYDQLIKSVETSDAQGIKISNIRDIMKREKVDSVWAAADQNLTVAQELSEITIPAILEKDDSDDDEYLRMHVVTLRQSMAQALTASRNPGSRVQDLVTLSKNAGPRYTEVKKQVEATLAQSEAVFTKPLETKMPDPSSGTERIMTLQAALDVLPKVFPPKAGYFEEQVMEYTNAQQAAKKHLRKAKSQLDLGVPNPQFDVGRFQKHLQQAGVEADRTGSYLDQMADAIDELNTDERLYIVSMKKSPTFLVQTGCETWGGGSCNTSPGTHQVNESQWRQYQGYMQSNRALHEDWDSSDWGSSEWVEDASIGYTYVATFVTQVNGVKGQPETRKISEEEFYDYYEAGQAFTQKMGKIFQMKVQPCHKMAEEGESICMQVFFGDGKKGALLIESKTIGQFAEEGSEVPAPEGIPVANVGDEQYGRWEGHGENRSWHWHPWYGHYYGGHGFMSGYLWGSMIHGGYGWGWYDGYSGWRHRNYGSSGNWRYDSRGNRAYVGKSTPGSSYRASSVRSGRSYRGGGPGAGK